MAKKTNFKELLVEKGERVGLIVAVVLLVAFVGLGGYIASTSASATDINNDFKGKIQTVEGKINGNSEPPAPLDEVTRISSSVMPHIDFTRFKTPNELFNGLGIQTAKLYNPTILPVIEAQAEFVRGSAGIYDISPDGKTIFVISNRPATQNEKKKIGSLVDRNKSKAKAQPRAGQPGQPGGMPGGGMPGFPGGGRGGGDMGSGFGRGGMPGMPGAQAQGAEPEIAPMRLDSPDADKYPFAEALQPLRMVVVSGAIPYKKQLEEYARALQKEVPENLSTEELPLYRGLVVQRQIWSLDGTKQLEDWKDLDLDAMTWGYLYPRLIEIEDDWDPRAFKSVERDPKLEPFLQYVIPDDIHNLVYFRPKLKRGQYQPIELKHLDAALHQLQKDTATAEGPKNRMQQRLGNKADERNRSFFGGGTGGMPGGMPGGLPGSFPGGGRGSGRGGGDDMGGGLPGKPGSGRGGMIPPGGAMPPGNIPPGGGMAGNTTPTSIEEAWLVRFIDVTVQPGYSYAYQVKVKAANPNFNKPKELLATHNQALKEELESEYYVLPNLVQVPPEEFIYAAAQDEKKNPPRVTTKMPQGNNVDETYVQMQRWFDIVHPKEGDSWNLGEWMLADIKAIRGQYLGETVQVPAPYWSMVYGMFIQREIAKAAPRRGMFDTRPANPSSRTPTWPVEFLPKEETLVVDFEGGRGPYPGARGKPPIQDEAAVEILLMTVDGKLRLARSSDDLVDEGRVKREKQWTDWIEQVKNDTLQMKNQGQPGGPGGMPGRGGGPGGGGGGSGGSGGR
jgi:uncharacterized membrane protein YgcG